MKVLEFLATSLIKLGRWLGRCRYHGGPSPLDFATRELSQDAVIAWLLAWADGRFRFVFPAMHRTGLDLLNVFFRAHDEPELSEGPRVTVLVQEQRVDVLALIDDRWALVIEDKVEGLPDQEQLEAHERVARSAWSERRPLFTCVRTGEPRPLSVLKARGWRHVGRGQLLATIARVTECCHDLLEDFRRRLAVIEREVQSFTDTPPERWSGSRPWAGFYEAVAARLGEGEWGDVNPPGGEGAFLGFWWGWSEIPSGRLYCQLEMEQLCVKVQVHDPALRSTVRNEWSERVLKAAVARSLELRKPRRFGSGQFMTVAELVGDYRVTNTMGRLDLERTCAVLTSVAELAQQTAAG